MGRFMRFAQPARKFYVASSKQTFTTMVSPQMVVSHAAKPAIPALQQIVGSWQCLILVREKNWCLGGPNLAGPMATSFPLMEPGYCSPTATARR